MASESDGRAGIAEVSATWKAFNSSWNVAAEANVTRSSPYRGVWLAKVPLVPCPADLDGSGAVDGSDLGVMLTERGAGRSAAADLNDDGLVDGVDLGILLGAWGEC